MLCVVAVAHATLPSKAEQAAILNSRVAQALASSASKLWGMINEGATQPPKDWFGVRSRLDDKGVSFLIESGCRQLLMHDNFQPWRIGIN